MFSNVAKNMVFSCLGMDLAMVCMTLAMELQMLRMALGMALPILYMALARDLTIFQRFPADLSSWRSGGLPLGPGGSTQTCFDKSSPGVRHIHSPEGDLFVKFDDLATTFRKPGGEGSGG